jgi:hypothetical protein
MKFLLLISSCDKIDGLPCLIILSTRNVELRGLWYEINTDGSYGSKDSPKDIDRDPILRDEHIV